MIEALSIILKIQSPGNAKPHKLIRVVRLLQVILIYTILPIRIHDLEPEDVKLFEKETGSVLRSMDFVFKTVSGVNRPLKPNEDNPQDNLNRAFYSDQINKVAHAIKEIVLWVKREPVPGVNEKSKDRVIPEEAVKEEKSAEFRIPALSAKSKLLSTLAIIAVIIVTGSVRSLRKALEINSTFTFTSFYIAFAYS